MKPDKRKIIMKVEGYTQISCHDIDWSYRDNRSGDKLKGKVVEKIGFFNNDDVDNQMFLILFTDKTFICVGLEYKDENYSNLQLDTKWIYSDEMYKSSVSKYHTYINSETGEVTFDTWIQMLIDFGLWHISPDEAKQIKEEHEKSIQEREYSEYLRLKAKYEGN